MTSVATSAATSEPPVWTREADRLIGAALSHARVIGVCTPVNSRAALEELIQGFDAGQPRPPELSYARPEGSDPRPSLEAAARDWEPREPLGPIYAERARELVLEIGLCREAGRPGFAALAERRYPRRDAHDDEADRRTHRWLTEDRDEPVVRDIVSDDEQDPASLVSRLRAEVGARRLAVRIVLAKRLASLAAVGPGIIYVGRGKAMSQRDVERTVLHEIEGHAAPRLRAAGAALGIFSRGTARGSDEQEGRALLIEERHGFLDAGRRLELARRHLAGRCVRDGADVVETVRTLRRRDTPLRAAARIALRSHRGGGLARELVYVPAWLRVRAALEREPGLERVLESGQVAVGAASTLRAWCPRASCPLG
jgi:hypothetical protein